ncbi:hypothetical protein P152DRAFT_458503 [Eremomyces bilateralis CBS 781.70]|uniref:Uncharacterized protein n=1 Tax=Eremomyces bilateralis CBS 781.70 TaxID=1392243 RepID=A0A6G1G426_9PEZI|nr:uncharacterized protein P152DRAFT_458503 [Eremomyces bilateralis CBS 781.70]KAF1812691.1 hypothetical protein P152DRAFT_458503 [Eremomyces bilateralis CBS 781.70]
MADATGMWLVGGMEDYQGDSHMGAVLRSCVRIAERRVYISRTEGLGDFFLLSLQFRSTKLGSNVL